MKPAAKSLNFGLTWEQSALCSVASHTGTPSLAQLFNLFDQFTLDQVHFVLFGGLQETFLVPQRGGKSDKGGIPRIHIGRSRTVLCLSSGRLQGQEPAGVEEGEEAGRIQVQVLVR